MSPSTARLLRDAKLLDHDQIAGLVHELLRVLDDAEGAPDQDVASAWRDELGRRVTDVENGTTQPVDGPETVALARAELASRRA